MERYDFVIVGGGPAGLAAAATLASARDHLDEVKNASILVIDEDNSDLKRALLRNFPAVEVNAKGPEVLERMRSAVGELGVDFKKDKVIRIEGSDGDFTIETASGGKVKASKVILATGFHRFDVEGLPFEVVPHPVAPRPNKVALKTDERQRVLPGIYAAGLVAGAQTMVATAMGSGTQAALNLLSDLVGRTVIVHDVLKKT